MAEHDDSLLWQVEWTPTQTAVDTDVRRTPDGALAVTARSICAACRGNTVRRVRKVIPGPHKGAGREQEHIEIPTDLREITFICDCGHQHPDRPPGELGCGRYWRVELP